MMLMAVRLQKSQVASPIYTRTSAGSYNFDRTIYCMAGYTKFDVLIIGASGGRAGNAFGTTIKTKTSWLYGAAGGGGGALRLQGDLAALPQSTPFTVGASGSVGSSSSGNNVKADNGSNGGTSTFLSSSYAAYGGKGAIGGKIDVSGGSFNTTGTGQGGDGGFNSFDVGFFGLGGENSQSGGGYDTSTGDITVAEITSPSAPSAGTYSSAGIVSGPFKVVGGGGGGGGGIGRERFLNNTTDFDQPQNGRNGNSGTNTTSTGATAPTNNGGYGGGCDEFLITGIHDYHGVNDGTGGPNGWVGIKLS